MSNPIASTRPGNCTCCHRARVVCYSGGHSSGLVAIEIARRFGTNRLVLLNHDINPLVEDQDIKRFKAEVAAYIGVPVTYANMDGWESKDQFDVVMQAGAFKVGNGMALCTNRLKTRPFEKYLGENFATRKAILYYGFDAGETARIQRRFAHLSSLGYRAMFPLTWAHRTIHSTDEIGVAPPNTYGTFKHANCVGCLKAGRQHWYVVYCLRPDVWIKGKVAEAYIDYTIIKGVSLTELEPLFARMKAAGVEPTERIAAGTFWARVRRLGLMDEPLTNEQTDERPCECAA